MSRFTAATQRCFPDDRIDLCAQTGWISAPPGARPAADGHHDHAAGSHQHAEQQVRQLEHTVRTVENFSTPVHDGPLESALMPVQGVGTADWRLVTVHEAING
jgi:hypothetical protein